MKPLSNKCIAWKKFEGTNPAREVKKLEESKGRLRYLEPEEKGALLEAAGEPLRTMVLVGIYTGLRLRSEALTLEWQDVNLNRGMLIVQAAYAKNGESRTVPLKSLVRNAFEDMRKEAGHVFVKADGSPYKSIRTAFETACRRANLTGVKLHTLRHTFGSRLAMSGVDLRTIQELGGWANLDMVQRYSHLSPSHKAEAVERIVEVFHNVIHNTPETTNPGKLLTI